MSRELLLLLTLLWPLLLATSLAFAGTRGVVRHLTPWAGLPALLLAASTGGSATELPWFLLGGMLHLDVTGRQFLILAASLSLAAGVLLRKQLADRHEGTRDSLLLLLTTSGLLWLTLAGDALLFFTAATVLGYALYALLVPGAGVASRVFAVLLVIGDLVIFELLLVLAHDVGSTTFAAFRHGLLLSAYPAEIFYLLLIGFGIKLGLIGFHVWLPPALSQAAAPVRLLLLGFVFCIGLLGWLRLLPLGEVYWPDAGGLLRWLALATLGYAIVVGMMQRQRHSMLAYELITLGALFLWLLGAVLAEPTLWPELYSPLQGALILAGFTFAVLLLLPGHLSAATATWLHRSFNFTGWLATLLLVMIPLGIINTLTAIDPHVATRFTWIGLAFVLLPFRSLRLKGTVAVTGELRALVAVLALSAIFAAVHYLSFVSLESLLQPAVLMLLPAAIGWLLGGALSKRFRPLPPGDLLGPVERMSMNLIHAFYRLGNTQVATAFRNTVQWLLHLTRILAWQQKLLWLEGLLGRWSVAMFSLLLFGLALAGLVGLT